MSNEPLIIIYYIIIYSHIIIIIIFICGLVFGLPNLCDKKVYILGHFMKAKYLNK